MKERVEKTLEEVIYYLSESPTFRDNIANLIKELYEENQSLKADKWLPIETIPVDIPVLICGDNYGKRENGQHYGIGRYDSSNAQIMDDGECGGTYCYATHWQPLPESALQSKEE